MSRIVTTAALAGALLAGPAIGVAAPAYGGAQLVAAQVETQTTRGFHLATPDLIASPSGVRVHGLVCRTSTTPATAPRVIRMEHLDASMRVIGTADAQPSGVLGQRRSLGCATYDVNTDWTLHSTDTVRVQAAS